MTTLQIEHLADGGADREPRKLLRINWTIARGAINTVGGTSRTEHTLSIEATLRDDFTVDGVRISIDGTPTLEFQSRDARGAWTRDEHDLLLVRIYETGVDTPLIDLTMETEGEITHVLYARTTILHSLGVSGGRYELAGATLVSETNR